MPKVTLRFYEELNDFLPKYRRKVDFEARFKGKRSIKDMIESFGVPHTEIDLILVDGTSVDFNYILQDGNRIGVYPVFESLNIAHVTHLRKIPLRKSKFIADVNLGDIVKYMRALGFDLYFDALLSTYEIIDISKIENRIILTKNRKLLNFKKVSHAIFIRPGTTTEQIRYIIDYLDIKGDIKPFSRCLRCNTLLDVVPKKNILDRIPPKTKAFCDEFAQCRSCDKIYWRGTHYENMQKVLNDILE